MDSKETLLQAEYFEEEHDYILELRAVYKDYEEIARSDKIELSIGKIRQMPASIY